MKPTKNAAQAGANVPANDKAPDAPNARGPNNNTSKCLNFNQHAEQMQGKRLTSALVADLTLHPANQLRELYTNRSVLIALKLAESMGHQYFIGAGKLMATNGDALAMTLASDANVENLTASVLVAHSRMSEISDTTAWTLLLCNEISDVVAQELEATQS